MHAVAAMFRRRICRNGAVVGFAEDRTCICRGGWHRAKYIGCRRLFSERFLTILRAVDGAVAAVVCAVGQAARRGWWSLAKDEEFNEGAN